jgi:hypothetical protein
MKTIKAYFVILVSLTMIFGSQTYLFAAEEASSIMCDEGAVNIGDTAVDVQDKCGEPDSKNMNEWQYIFGPAQPVYKVIFKEGKVVRILESE